MPKKPPSLSNEARRVAVEQELRDALVRAQRQASRAQATAEHAVSAIYRAARDAALAAGPTPAVPRPARRKVDPSRVEAALLHATDWQVGKRTESYSLDTARERIKNLASKVVYLTDIQESARPIPDIHVLLGGDMVDGVNIFPGHHFEIEAGLYEQLFVTARLIEDMLRVLAARFQTVHVWEATGNHGRLSRRGDYPKKDNADALLYGIVRERFPRSAQLVWHPASNWYQIVEIGAYRALLVHGDQVRAFGGNIPAYGIIRKALSWRAGVLEPFADAYVGHFHTHMSLPLADAGHVFVTGSPESGNEYAREFCNAKGVPSQRLHFINPRKGLVVSEHQIYL